MSSIFDQMTATSETTDAASPHQDSVPADNPTPDGPANTATFSPEQPEPYTSKALKATSQELLKLGLLEADRKPNLYQTALTQQHAINLILEPFDLSLKIDDVRGLAFLVVADPVTTGQDDEWSHPLVRKQRLTLEQSLLIAILRQHYIVHEQEAGIGTGDARVTLDDLLPQLQIYLGDTGSDAREQKRLRTLLENLKGHGVVSEVDSQEQVTIRPIIAHLCNPESLQNLLQHFRQQAGNVTSDTFGTASTQESEHE